MNKNKILIFIILFLIPISVISFLVKSKLKTNINVSKPKETKFTVIDNEPEPENLNSKITINVLVNNEKTTMNLEEYLVGVLAGEMPASFEMEALKAQAVAARSYAVYKIEHSTGNYDVIDTINDQVYLTKEKMQQNWQEKYDENYKKIYSAVAATQSQVLKQNNEVIKAFFFSMSNGYTEDSVQVFKEGNIKSVESKWEETAKNFIVTKDFKEEEIKEKLGISDKILNIEILKRSNTNRVEKIKVNDKIFTGIEFRKLLQLRSTDFTIEKNNDCYQITTKGNGHGVGMSQYGANGMAEEGKTYQEILKYYYNDVEITKL